MSRVWIVPFVLSCLTFGGCAKLGELGSALDAFLPKVTFRTVKVTGLTFQDIDTNFVFDVENPNPIKVKLSSFSYDLDLAGKNLINGNQSDGLTLEARGDSRMVFPVGVVFKDLFALVGDLKGKDAVPFTFKGSIGFNTPLGEVKIPFQDTGDFPVVHAPKVRFKAVKVGRLDLLKQQATINLDLGFTHDGGSTIGLDAFDYGIKLGGREVIHGLIDTLAKVPAGQEQAVSLPVTLNLLDLGATIVDAITKKTKLNVGLDAKLSVATPFGAVPFTFDEQGLVDVL